MSSTDWKSLAGAVLAGVVANAIFGGLTAPSSPRPQPLPTDAECVPPLRTGGDDPIAWTRSRFIATRAALSPLPGVVGLVPLDLVEPIARSLVAQWAHESNAGRSEYNFNLGGWIARRGRPCHVLRDGTTGRPLKWEAWPDLGSSIVDHIDRLAHAFPSAWALLLRDPTSDAWVRELGRKGYYEARPEQYAAAWRTRRAELERTLATGDA